MSNLNYDLTNKNHTVSLVIKRRNQCINKQIGISVFNCRKKMKIIFI